MSLPELLPIPVTPLGSLPPDHRRVRRVPRVLPAGDRNGHPEGGGYEYRPGEAEREAALAALVAAAQERAGALHAMEAL